MDGSLPPSKKRYQLQLRSSIINLVDAARVALMNAGSLLKEKIKRLGQSNLSEEQKLSRTPVKAKPADLVGTDVGLQKVKLVKLNLNVRMTNFRKRSSDSYLASLISKP